MIIKQNRPLIIVKSGNAQRPGTQPEATPRKAETRLHVPVAPDGVQATRTDESAKASNIGAASRIDTTDNFQDIRTIWRSLPRNESFLNKIGAVLQILMRQLITGSNKAKQQTVAEGVTNYISPSTGGIAKANETVGNENPVIANTEAETSSASNGGSFSAEAVQQLVRDILEKITTPEEPLGATETIVDENPRVTTPCLSEEDVLELIRTTLEGTTTQSNSLGANETIVDANPVIANTEAKASLTIEQLIRETLREVMNSRSTQAQPSQTDRATQQTQQTPNQATQTDRVKQSAQQIPSQAVQPIRQTPTQAGGAKQQTQQTPGEATPAQQTTTQAIQTDEAKQPVQGNLVQQTPNQATQRDGAKQPVQGTPNQPESLLTSDQKGDIRARVWEEMSAAPLPNTTVEKPMSNLWEDLRVRSLSSRPTPTETKVSQPLEETLGQEFPTQTTQAEERQPLPALLPERVSATETEASQPLEETLGQEFPTQTTQAEERQPLPALLPKLSSERVSATETEASQPLEETLGQEFPVIKTESPSVEDTILTPPAFLADLAELAARSKLPNKGGITTVGDYQKSLEERRETAMRNLKNGLSETGMSEEQINSLPLNTLLSNSALTPARINEIINGNLDPEELSPHEQDVQYGNKYNLELLKKAIEKGIDRSEAESLLQKDPAQLQRRIRGGDETEETINPLSSLRFLPTEVSELLGSPNIPAEIKDVLPANSYDRGLIENLSSYEERRRSASPEGEEGEPPTLEEFLQDYEERLREEQAAKLAKEEAEQQVPFIDSPVAVGSEQVVDIPTEEDQEAVPVTTTANVAEKTQVSQPQNQP